MMEEVLHIGQCHKITQVTFRLGYHVIVQRNRSQVYPKAQA